MTMRGEKAGKQGNRLPVVILCGLGDRAFRSVKALRQATQAQVWRLRFGMFVIAGRGDSS